MLHLQLQPLTARLNKVFRIFPKDLYTEKKREKKRSIMFVYVYIFLRQADLRLTKYYRMKRSLDMILKYIHRQKYQAVVANLQFGMPKSLKRK